MRAWPRVDPLDKPWLWIAVVLLVHTGVFFALPPQGWLVRDEVAYVKQAAAFARGSATAELWDGTRGRFTAAIPSQYPPGTSLLMALPVRVFGPRGAFLVPWLASLVLVLGTALWLQREGHSPLFALLTLTYPPTIVLSRLAMSDVPSAALVASSLALFATGVTRARPGAWLGAGLLCGASLCLRETNPLLLLPLFAGALLRRERHAWALILGSGVGAALRLLSSELLFGDPFFHRPVGEGFTIAAFAAHLPIYLFAALCFVPGGLYWVLRYRGPRRIEIAGTVFGFIAFYAAYRYAAWQSGFVKTLILAPRYLIPMTPLLALCAAAAFTRSRADAHGTSARARRYLPAALVIATCLLTTSIAVGMNVHARRQSRIQDAIAAHVAADDLVVTNVLATEKLLFGARIEKYVDLQTISDLRSVLGHADRFWVIVLDRRDSAFWLAMQARNEARLRASAARVRLELVLERSFPSAGDQRLRIFRARVD